MDHAQASSYACRAAGRTGMPLAGRPGTSRLAQAKVLFVSVLTCIALLHCDKPKEQPPAVKLGEPVGVRVDDVKDATGKNLGSFQAAFAVTQGQAPDPLVPGMARVLDRCAKNCPTLFAKGSEPMHLRGKVSGGALSFAAASDGDSDMRCFRDALHGQKVSDTPFESDIAIELRPQVGP